MSALLLGKSADRAGAQAPRAGIGVAYISHEEGARRTMDALPKAIAAFEEKADDLLKQAKAIK